MKVEKINLEHLQLTKDEQQIVKDNNLMVLKKLMIINFGGRTGDEHVNLIIVMENNILN